MHTTGRSAAVLLAALSSFVLASCDAGEPAASSTPTRPATGSATPTPAACAGPAKEVGVPSYGPSGYVGDMPGDMPPDYASNHAFQRRMRLCGEALVTATREAARAHDALGDLSETTAPAVQDALAGLGYRPDHLTVTSAPAGTTFVVEVEDAAHHLAFCLDGTVAPGGVAVRPGGIYSEGGCTMPVGGH